MLDPHTIGGREYAASWFPDVTGIAPLAISCLSRPVVMRSSDAVVGFLRAVLCVQVRLRGRFARPTHALERQPAQPVLRVDLGAREPAENVAAVHAQTPESSPQLRARSRRRLVRM